MFSFLKRQYMSWGNFARLMKEKDFYLFIDATAKKSINNYWKRHRW